MLKQMRKKAVACIILPFMLFCFGTVGVFASPEILTKDTVSTHDGLVTVCAPESDYSSTTNRKLAVSAVASPGTIVTVYRYDPNTQCYHKMWVNGEALEATVGSSWLFATQVDLQQGENKFLVRGAWDENTYSVARFNVNLLNEGFMDRVKGVISVIFN